MPVYRDYFRRLYDQIEHVVSSEGAHIETAASWMAASIASDGIVHLFGSGHSHMIAEEVFHRAGSLMPLNPMLDVNLTFLGSVNATLLERTPGYGRVVVGSHDIRPGEVVIVISNSGVNPVPIEVALEAKALGAQTIAITSDENYRQAPSRHASGKRLAQVVDLTIDTLVPAGDALIEIPGNFARTGGVSSVIGISLINAIVAETADRLQKMGITPPIIPTMNLPGGDEAMEALLERYAARLPLLKRA
ncbi:MAG TPA: SIS domain-containing protein [Thermomicrobiales bacterium]|nr:SIS domain-containing protein [Thermomicrobiales bacterium]